MSQLRKIQRQVQKNEEAGVEEVPVNHLMLPVGKVLSDPVRGEHLSFPLFGWVAARAKERTPLVMLAVILLDLETQETKGTLQIEFPIFTETEATTLSVLTGYGWDGRIWPEEAGWPDEGDDAEHLRRLLKEAHLKNTFVFPPQPDGGYFTQTVNISRARGPFLMPPLIDSETSPDPELLEKFRRLVVDPKKFL